MSGVVQQALEHYAQKRETLQEDVRVLDRKIYDLEGAYLGSESSQCGTVFKGFEGFMSSKDANRRRGRVFKADERLFSLSSLTSPAHQEVEAAIEAEQGVGGGKKGKR